MRTRHRDLAAAVLALTGGLVAASRPALAEVNVWTSVEPVSAPVVAIRVVPSTPSRVYAALAGRGILRSDDGGRTWAPANAGLTDLRALNLAADPANPATLFVTTGVELDGSPDHGGVFRSRNGGASWERLPGSPGDSAALAVVPGQPSIVLAGYFGGAFASTDEGSTWSTTFSYGVHTFAVDPSDSGTAFLGGLGTFESVGDVLRSRDRGRTWEALAFPRDLTIGALAVSPGSPPVVYAGKVGGGVWKSPDGGASWAPASEGLGSRTVHAFAVDPVRPWVVYAGTSGGIYRSTDAGNRWTPFKDGLGERSVTALAAAPSGRRLYAGTDDNGLWALDVCDEPECAAAGSAVRVVPLVLDAPGTAGGRTSTEITLLNGGTSAATARLEVAGTPTEGASLEAAIPLGPGQQLTIPDVAGFLRERGLPIPGDQAWSAVLRVTFTGLSPSAPVAAIARTTSPGPFGTNVTGTWGVEPDPAVSTLRVFGLRETPDESSELVVVNGRADAIAHVVVRVQDALGDEALPPTPVAVGPGGSSRLPTGLRPGSSGFATVTGGPGDEFFAFGLVTDRSTKSAAYMPGAAAGTDHLIAPALVETDRYETELVLAAGNGDGARLPILIDASFRDSFDPAGVSKTHRLALDPPGEVVVPRAVDWLRQNGFDVGTRERPRVGSLTVSAENGSLYEPSAFAFAASRVLTRNPAGPGAFSTGFLTKTERSTGGVVPGLVQDVSTRSNLAILNPNDEPIGVRIQIVDESGSAVPESDVLMLGPGEWRQINAVLWLFGIRRGWARVRTVCCARAGDELHALPFFAYGVVNLGPVAGTGTGGGTCIPMNPR